MVNNTIGEVGLDELEEVIAASASRRRHNNRATVQVIGTSALKAGACVCVCVHVACFPEGIV